MEHSDVFSLNQIRVDHSGECVGLDDDSQFFGACSRRFGYRADRERLKTALALMDRQARAVRRGQHASYQQERRDFTVDFKFVFKIGTTSYWW